MAAGEAQFIARKIQRDSIEMGLQWIASMHVASSEPAQVCSGALCTSPP